MAANNDSSVPQADAGYQKNSTNSSSNNNSKSKQQSQQPQWPKTQPKAPFMRFQDEEEQQKDQQCLGEEALTCLQLLGEKPHMRQQYSAQYAQQMWNKHAPIMVEILQAAFNLEEEIYHHQHTVDLQEEELYSATEEEAQNEESTPPQGPALQSPPKLRRR